MMHEEALVSAEGFEVERQKNPDLWIVDVREPDEFEQGHLEGARLIPLGEIASRAESELPRDAEIVVVCAHGIRSLEGLMALRMLGFEKTRSLQGGMAAWYEHQAQLNH